MPLKIAVLGSTGSVGRQTLEVVRGNPEKVRVVALAAHRNAALLAEQAREFGVERIALGAEELALGAQAVDGSMGTQGADASTVVWPDGAQITYGAQAVEELCAGDEVDLVLNALVGAAGLRASYATLKEGRILALANKESLVVGGDLLMPLAAARPGSLLPVDSEHSAIFQSLIGEARYEVANIWLTASGGPFRGRTRAQLEQVTKDEALAHPTWLMGPKITIDCATLMNKGLEAIEAHHLFALPYEQIRIVVHPQSCIHSMVEYVDGSVKAHLGVTDMRMPIQYALSYPARWGAPMPPLDFTQLGQLTFEAPDQDTFGCLRLALEAGRIGGTAPAVLNAANEVAVAGYLAGRCGFTDIERIVEATLEAQSPQQVESLEQLQEIDVWARVFAEGLY